ncbi:MAG: o-succinylbenzoate synthase [Cytophagaceae bacterium SCN 52-12]|nr:MAG: o-succinylbenzoate synthase [Cytophagaceae bacterium SCN 52-12]
MSLLLSFAPHTLKFKFEAGTSRGVLTSKTTYIATVRDHEFPEVYGVGECGPLKGLSPDDLPDLERILSELAVNFNRLSLGPEGWDYAELLDSLVSLQYPAVRFGLETALCDFQNGGRRVYFDNDFSKGKQSIDINGLIWMGTPAFMEEQIEAKLASGYKTLKMKVGAIDFEQECRLLEGIRKRFSAEEITLRVDANGAFQPGDALRKLERLAAYDLHSIEQPVAKGQPELMAGLVRESPLAIALDEELIGVVSQPGKRELLETIRPPFIVLKPTLLGGFAETRQWIAIAEEMGIRWWITSALESNIGLNAIAQFTAEFANPLPQGLGTGQLYENNFGSGLMIENGRLRMVPGTNAF